MFKKLYPATSVLLIFSFIGSSLYMPQAHAGELMMPLMPKPGTMVSLSSRFEPAYLKGIIIHPDNALKFDFLVNKGDSLLSVDQKKQEYGKLIKYFLAALTVPDKDQWVNLSPYEKSHIIEGDFGKTEMGRDLLEQDYLLKQITSSLMYPESGLGKKFWDKVYAKAYQKFGNTDIPVNTFNKVWIVPDQAVVYESGNIAYVVKSHLKVMLEEDYLSLTKHKILSFPNASVGNPEHGSSIKTFEDDNVKTHTVASRVIREIILPALEKEVNEDKNFAPLRQVFASMLLATWYKKALKESLLGRIFADKAKTQGVDQNPKNNEVIYKQYLSAFKKGVYNYIKEDSDKYTHQTLPRKYFAGGTYNNFSQAMVVDREDMATLVHSIPASSLDDTSIALNPQTFASSRAMLSGEPFDGVILGEKAEPLNENFYFYNFRGMKTYQDIEDFLDDRIGPGRYEVMKTDPDGHYHKIDDWDKQGFARDVLVIVLENTGDEVKVRLFQHIESRSYPQFVLPFDKVYSKYLVMGADLSISPYRQLDEGETKGWYHLPPNLQVIGIKSSNSNAMVALTADALRNHPQLKSHVPLTVVYKAMADNKVNKFHAFYEYHDTDSLLLIDNHGRRYRFVYGNNQHGNEVLRIDQDPNGSFDPMPGRHQVDIVESQREAVADAINRQLQGMGRLASTPDALRSPKSLIAKYLELQQRAPNTISHQEDILFRNLDAVLGSYSSNALAELGSLASAAMTVFNAERDFPQMSYMLTIPGRGFSYETSYVYSLTQPMRLAEIRDFFNREITQTTEESFVIAVESPDRKSYRIPEDFEYRSQVPLRSGAYIKVTVTDKAMAAKKMALKARQFWYGLLNWMRIGGAATTLVAMPAAAQTLPDPSKLQLTMPVGDQFVQEPNQPGATLIIRPASATIKMRTVIEQHPNAAILFSAIRVYISSVVIDGQHISIGDVYRDPIGALLTVDNIRENSKAEGHWLITLKTTGGWKTTVRVIRLEDFHHRGLELVKAHFLRPGDRLGGGVQVKWQSKAMMTPENLVRQDHAMPGGIDFNSANFAMTIKRDGHGVPLPLAQQDMAQLALITGFRAKILEIKPASSLPFLSGTQH